MSVIMNPRGTSGAGKTEFVRQIMARYGAGPGSADPVFKAMRMYLADRSRPIGYTLRHRCRGRPLAVLGAYEASVGGCDTIPESDGGLDEAFRIARACAADGHDVLLEGLSLSSDVDRTRSLAREYAVHVLQLATPVENSIRNVIRRRRARRKMHADIAERVIAQEQAVQAACEALRACAVVERLPFDDAIRLVRHITH
jgi:predicted kinase